MWNKLALIFGIIILFIYFLTEIKMLDAVKKEHNYTVRGEDMQM